MSTTTASLNELQNNRHFIVDTLGLLLAVIMLSGDNQQVANSVAKEVGIDEAFGDLMPDDKVAAIKKLSAQEGGLNC